MTKALHTVSSCTFLFSPSGMHTDLLWCVLQPSEVLHTVSNCDLSIPLGMPSDLLWCVLPPARCSGQSVIVFSSLCIPQNAFLFPFAFLITKQEKSIQSLPAHCTV